MNPTDESERSINLKDLLFPIVGITRLYALNNNVHETNTVERINTLSNLNVFHPHSRDKLVTSFNFLNDLRLKYQISSIQMNLSPTNIVPANELTKAEEQQLHEAYTQINLIQKKVSMDFLGSSQI